MAKALADMSDSEFKAAFRKWCAPPLVGYSYPTVTFPCWNVTYLCRRRRIGACWQPLHLTKKDQMSDYRIEIKGELPLNLATQVYAVHANAILKTKLARCNQSAPATISNSLGDSERPVATSAQIICKLPDSKRSM